MIPEIRFFPSPGLMVDTAKMIAFKLGDKKYWSSSIWSSLLSEEDLTFITEQAKHFPDLPRELFLFIYRKNSNAPNYLTPMVENLYVKDFASFSPDIVLDYLSDTPVIRNEVLSFYLGQRDYSQVDVETLIRINDDLTDRIRFYLLDFSLNPQFYTSSLKRCIQQYYKIFQDLHARNSLVVMDEPKIEDLANLLVKAWPSFGNKILNRPFYYSSCYLVPAFCYANIRSTHSIVIVGTNYEVGFTEKFSGVDLSYIGTAFSDKTRLRVLYLLLASPNLTVTEIAQSLNISLTSVNHHLSKLIKAQFVSRVQENKQHYYSLNRIGFENAAAMFEKIAEQIKLPEEE